MRIDKVFQFLIPGGMNYDDETGDREEQVSVRILPLHAIKISITVHHFRDEFQRIFLAGYGLVYVRFGQFVFFEFIELLKLFDAEFIDLFIFRLMRQILRGDKIAAPLKFNDDASKIPPPTD